MSVYGGNFGKTKKRPVSRRNEEAVPVPCQEKQNSARSGKTGERQLPFNVKLPFDIDRDTLLLAALLYLLIKDGGDMKLILALGYILIS